MSGLDTRYMSEAYKALRTEQGQRAVAEGWGIPLWEFVLKFGKCPSRLEEQGLRAQAEKIAEAKAGWLPCARCAHDARLAKFERVANGKG